MTDKIDEVPDLMDLGEFKDQPTFEWNAEQEEEITDTSTDSQEEPTDSPETKTEPTNNDWFLEFNKSINGNYGSLDEVKSILDEFGSLKDKVSKIGDYEAVLQEKAAVEKTRDLLIEKYRELKDPKTFFSDEIEYKQNQLVKSNPTINREVARKAFEINVETANPLDIIALNMQLTHSKLTGGEAGAKEMFLVKNGIDVEIGDSGNIDLSELTRAQVNLINLEAEEAARNIVRVRDSVQLPEPSGEVEELIQKWIAEKEVPQFDVKKWDGHIENVIKAVDVFEVKEGDDVLYSEPIDSEYKSDLADVVRDTIIQLRLDPTPENIKTLADGIKKDYAVENMPQIMKRFKSFTELKIKEAVHKELHNDADPDKGLTNTKPQTGRTTPLSTVLGIR